MKRILTALVALPILLYTVWSQFPYFFVGLAVVGAVWGGLGALAQDDVRRLIGYSSLAQLSLVLLGIGAETSVALEGAVLLLVAHGFAMADLPVYDHDAAERHFARTLELWRRNLPSDRVDA